MYKFKTNIFLNNISSEGTHLVIVVGLVTKTCSTLCNPVDCSSPGPSVCGITQARILEWLPFPPPVDLPDPSQGARDQTLVSCITGGLIYYRQILYQLNHREVPIGHDDTLCFFLIILKLYFLGYEQRDFWMLEFVKVIMIP